MNEPSGATVVLVAPETRAGLGRILRDIDSVAVQWSDHPEWLWRSDDDSDCIVVTDDLLRSGTLDVADIADATGAETGTVFVAFEGDERLAARALNGGIDRYVVADDSEDLHRAVTDAVGAVIDGVDPTSGADETRAADLELRESLIETAPIGIHVLDEDGTFLWANEAFASTVGRTPAELVGTPYRGLIDSGHLPPWFSQAYDDEVRDLLSPSNDVDTARMSAVPIRTEAGDQRLFDLHFALLPLEDGEFAGTVTALRDVTERKEYQRELERQNERLDKFASVLSHDLRNPLSVATGRIELARRERDDESRHLAVAENALERMERLVENVLTLARQGKLVGETTEVPVDEAAREAWLTSETREASLTVADGIETVDADETRLKQLFENLFRNSVDHAHADVTVTVGPLDDGFFVADDGPGIPESERDSLFVEEFSMADGGFGLNIVRTIATAHGWSVDVTESEAGGAQFEFRTDGAT
ncbi:ATP-binding protein [Haloarcula salina]|uniref:receiver/sensor box histidine kinase n=1 Tax=Haloarcula salina TaxID=1429914 RepID=UPI003C6FF9B9